MKFLLQFILLISLSCFTLFAQNGEEISVTHNGNADASVIVLIVNPDSLTGHDYEVFFNQQHYYLDFDGKWKEINYQGLVGQNLAKPSDLTGTSLSAIAYASPHVGTRDLKFVLYLISPDYDWSDGVLLKFPPEIVINSTEDALGNGDGALHSAIVDTTENAVLWGANDTSRTGSFTGDEVFTLNINTPTLPLDVDYVVYDDGWAVGYGAPYNTLGDGIVHAVGTCTITEEAYAFKTEKHWNLRDITTDKIILEDQTVIDGVDIYSGEEVGDPVIDGFQISVNGDYDIPIDFSSVTYTNLAGEEEEVGDLDGDQVRIGSYQYSGWEADAYATTTYGQGTADLTVLIKDYEIRFTGEFDTSYVGDDTLITVKEGTGSMAWLYGARQYYLEDHPMNPNPGVDDNFMVRIPFEVWCVDDDIQVNFIMYDRMQTAASTTWYAFNPNDRMYTEFLMTPYVETLPTEADLDNLTWNIVWWETPYVKGEKLTIIYTNPLTNLDQFLFTAPAGTAIDQTTLIYKFKLSQNYPNPFNSQTTIYYSLPKTSKVFMKIYNLLGQEVKTLVNEVQPLGENSVIWYGQNNSGQLVSSGIYIYEFKVDGRIKNRKMLFLK